MAFTQEMLTNIDNAISTGALEITHEGKTVKYGSLKHMMSVRSLIRKELGIIDGAPIRHTTTFNKGL